MSVESIDPKSTALLITDFQTLIVEGHATDREDLLARTATLLGAARKAGMLVAYIVVGFHAGYAEISPRNKTFSGLRQLNMFAHGNQATAIHSAVAPQGNETVVTKHRFGGFFGTDLDMILRANNIETLILTGIAASGVVLSTLRHAADADYRICVARDCCSDKDEEVHRVLLDKVFRRQATVLTSNELIRAL
jgi:nicotinamidase-related amidase